MQPAVLFWFYKRFDVSRERLGLLRAMNPGAAIFALFGGAPNDTDAARACTDGLADDFWCYPEPHDPRWKWRHGDQLIARWHRDRGRDLDWNTIFIMQWDLLAARPLAELFADLAPGEALFSGLRPFAEVEAWWPWADPSSWALYDFRKVLRLRLAYRGPLLACLFIVPCLPRVFLDRFVAMGAPRAGFLEYKLPTLAAALGIPVRNAHPHEPWWSQDPAQQDADAGRRALNAVQQEVTEDTILAELSRPLGRRLFHPVSEPLSPRLRAALHA
ncbi:MAG: hypothetical protein SFZ24_01620 [Planctomycetota bacterium]|nr:hypothetical protein [Planctomycetota bacterium]